MSAVLAMSIDVYPVVLPWPRIFEDMKERGLAYTKQAASVGAPWSTFQRWLDGEVEPRHSCATAFLELHTKVCGAELTRLRLKEGQTAI